MTENYHTHTYRCHHASGTEREYIENAITRGLTHLGFSDHVPMPFPDGHQSGFRVQIEELEDYVRTLERLREEYRDRIRISIGFEAEYYPAYFEDMLALLGKYDYDYLLLGQHFLDNETTPGAPTPTQDESMLVRYVEQVSAGLRTGKYTYLAHPDMINYQGDPAIYDKHMRRLCKDCLAMEIPLEINLLGLSGGRHYPSDRFFRIVSEVGNPVILGCDAHQPDSVAHPAHIAAGEAFAARYELHLLDHIEFRNPRV